jgi:ADP-ribosylglycohydrolase
MKKSRLLNKIYGCLIGGVIGDTLGRPLEPYGHFKKIEEKHGKVTDFLDVSAIGTDDTALNVLLCKTYIRKNARITSSDFARTWLSEMDPLPLFYCMRTSLELLKMGVPPRAAGAGNFVTGSAIMCIAPVGIYNATDPVGAYIDAKEITSMYQRGLDVEVAGIYAACIAEAMKPDASVDSILKCAIELAPPERLITFDKRQPDNIRDTLRIALDVASRHTDVFKAREDIYKASLQWHQLDPLEVLTLTLAIFKVANGDAEQAIVGGVNIGRDCDTIANLNGGLAGALHGFDSVPQRWTKLIEQKTDGLTFRLASGMENVVREKVKSQTARIQVLAPVVDACLKTPDVAGAPSPSSARPYSHDGTPSLEDRIYGCLMGGAAGTIFGRLFGNMPYQKIQEKYGIVEEPPAVNLQGYEEEYDNITGRYPYTVSLVRLLVDTYVRKNGRITSQDCARTWLADGLTPPVHYSLFVLNVLELLKTGIPPGLAGMGNPVCDDALVTISPVGIFNAGLPEEAYIDAVDIASMYQRDYGVTAAAVYAACIAEAMKPDASVDSVIECALAFSPRQDYVAFDPRLPVNIFETVKKAVRIAREFPDVFAVRQPLYDFCVSGFYRIDEMSYMNPIDILALSLAIFVAAKGNGRMCIVGGANLGVNSGSIANLSGALGCALNGIKSIPEKWVNEIDGSKGFPVKESSFAMADLLRRMSGVLRTQMEEIGSLTAEEK